MPATKADLDQLDDVLDRLDDYARAHPDDPAIDRIARDLTAWYGRMFRPAPPFEVDRGADLPPHWRDLARLVGGIRRAAMRMTSRPTRDRDPMAGHVLALAADACEIVEAVEGRR